MWFPTKIYFQFANQIWFMSVYLKTHSDFHWYNSAYSMCQLTFPKCLFFNWLGFWNNASNHQLYFQLVVASNKGKLHLRYDYFIICYFVYYTFRSRVFPILDSETPYYLHVSLFFIDTFTQIRFLRHSELILVDLFNIFYERRAAIRNGIKWRKRYLIIDDRQHTQISYFSSEY